MCVRLLWMLSFTVHSDQNHYMIKLKCSPINFVMFLTKTEWYFSMYSPFCTFRRTCWTLCLRWMTQWPGIPWICFRIANTTPSLSCWDPQWSAPYKVDTGLRCTTTHWCLWTGGSVTRLFDDIFVSKIYSSSQTPRAITREDSSHLGFQPPYIGTTPLWPNKKTNTKGVEPAPAGHGKDLMFVFFSSQVIKYGVISTESLIDDLMHWKTIYVAGRLHKPVSILIRLILNQSVIQNYFVIVLLFIGHNSWTLRLFWNIWAHIYPCLCVCTQVKMLVQNENGKLRAALVANLKSAVTASFLMLPESFTEEDLFLQIAGLSYAGKYPTKVH